MSTGQSIMRKLFVRTIIGLVLAMAWLGGLARPAQADVTGNVNVFLGAKGLNEDDWAPVEDQTELAVEFDFRERAWPLNLVIGLRGAHDEEDLGGLTVESTTSEMSLGIRKIFEPAPSIHPFIGGGLAFIGAEAKGTSVFGTASSSDAAPGIWLGGGIYWTLGEHFNLGFDIRVSAADVTIAGVDAKAGGGHFGLLLGYHF